MIIKDTMCYTLLLELMQDPSFAKSVTKTTFSQPNLDSEGFNGFIETDVEFTVFDIQMFSGALTRAREALGSEIYWSYRRKLLPQG